MKAKKIEAIKVWLEPKSIRSIQMFLRFFNFYRRFIQDFKWIAAPLILMLKITSSIKTIFSSVSAKIYMKAIGNSNFLISEAKLAFLRLKQAFTEASFLHHFDPKRYIFVKTDASSYVIGNILS